MAGLTVKPKASQRTRVAGLVMVYVAFAAYMIDVTTAPSFTGRRGSDFYVAGTLMSALVLIPVALFAGWFLGNRLFVRRGRWIPKRRRVAIVVAAWVVFMTLMFSAPKFIMDPDMREVFVMAIIAPYAFLATFVGGAREQMSDAAGDAVGAVT